MWLVDFAIDDFHLYFGSAAKNVGTQGSQIELSSMTARRGLLDAYLGGGFLGIHLGLPDAGAGSECLLDNAEAMPVATGRAKDAVEIRPKSNNFVRLTCFV